jgi:class 3 adenylate cyclase
LRVVSVLFVDLAGFTALSEDREAEDVRELLGRYFDAARKIVGRYGGSIEKFIGDAVMAVWGAPVASEDDGERAVRAALEIVEAVRVFGEQERAPDLRARAEVVTGRAAAVDRPGEGLVVGDRVNTASRVQSCAAPGEVWVDEITRQVAFGAVVFEGAGEHTVKGKTEPLRLWRAVRVIAGCAAQTASRDCRLAWWAATGICGWSKSSLEQRWSVGRRGWSSSLGRRAWASRGSRASSRPMWMGWPTRCCGIWDAAWPMGRGSRIGRWLRWSASA